ncbi:MAG: DUF3618 domain-containing protein [Propionibacteriaceae bacterium]|jgi:hypothetical protein|nr:DUF3618 domain-containing protein [Propionibacteriaceae bacterium]
MADNRTVAEIERDLEATRERLAANLASLVTEIHPRVVAHRTVTEARRETRVAIDKGKETVRATYRRALAVFKDDSGWKPRPLAVAGATVAVAVLVVVLTSKKPA